MPSPKKHGHHQGMTEIRLYFLRKKCTLLGVEACLIPMNHDCFSWCFCMDLGSIQTGFAEIHHLEFRMLNILQTSCFLEDTEEPQDFQPAVRTKNGMIRVKSRKKSCTKKM